MDPWPEVSFENWKNWQWQYRSSLVSQKDFEKHFPLTPCEKEGFQGEGKIFRIRCTPYYACLIDGEDPRDPIRTMVVPQGLELSGEGQQMIDPLGEREEKNRPCRRLIHRYSDRALFLITDLCAVYCRYCTRKHFTATDQILASPGEIQEALSYLRRNPGIKEVIFSGGDPLSLSNNKLNQIMELFYGVESLELIRIGTRMPVVCPMRIDSDLVDIFKKFKPVYVMTHFNHPREVTEVAAQALEKLVDSGVPVFNQMVLLNGVNNHPALIYALSRRLLYLRVKPYYMFQADPSQGTEHLKTSIDHSLSIQREMWGHASGLSMPSYVVDIPQGGGKTCMVPNFQVSRQGQSRKFVGWDGVSSQYTCPSWEKIQSPSNMGDYLKEWELVKGQKPTPL